MDLIGQKIPNISFQIPTPRGFETLTLRALTQDKKVILLGMVGAFTPVCSTIHLPSFVAKGAEFKRKGIDDILCLSVNDPFVLKAWACSLGLGDDIKMLADFNLEFTNHFKLSIDLHSWGLGERCRRFYMIVNNGIIEQYESEYFEHCSVTKADHILEIL